MSFPTVSATGSPPAETAATSSWLSERFSELWWGVDAACCSSPQQVCAFLVAALRKSTKMVLSKNPAALLMKPWLCTMEHALLCKYGQSLGHEGKQSVPVESVLSALISHVGRLSHIRSGGKCGAGLSNIWASYIFIWMVVLVYMVMREGDELNLSRTGRKKENPSVLPVVVLVVFMDLSSCSTGRQGSPLRRSISLYSLGGKSQRSNVHSNRCLSV